MTQYRVYVMSDTDHITKTPQIIDCADDDDAIARARQLLDGHAIEVWDRTRLIVRLDPKSASDSY